MTDAPKSLNHGYRQTERENHSPERRFSSFLLGLVIALLVAVAVIGTVLVTRLQTTPREVYSLVTDLETKISLLESRLQVTPGEVFEEVLGLQERIVQLEASLSYAEELLRLLEAQTAVIIGLDKDGRITLWSRGAEEAFDKPKEDVISSLPTFLFGGDPEEFRTHSDRFGKAMQQSGPYQRTVESTVNTAQGPKRMTMDIWVLPGHMALAVLKEADN